MLVPRARRMRRSRNARRPKRRLGFEQLDCRQLLAASPLVINGTAGDDSLSITFTSTTTFTLSFDNQQSNYSTTGANAVASVVFHGAGGRDTTSFNNHNGAVQATFIDHSVSVIGANFSFSADATESNTVLAWNGSSASFNPYLPIPNSFGNPYAANASVVVDPNRSVTFAAPDSGSTLGVVDEVEGDFKTIAVQARGDFDTATLLPNEDGIALGANTFLVDPTMTVTASASQLTMQTQSSTVSLNGFQTTVAETLPPSNPTLRTNIYYVNFLDYQPSTLAGTLGGNFPDSQRFVATPSYAYAQGKAVGPAGTARTTFYEAVGFNTVIATNPSPVYFANAFLYDSPGNDTFISAPGYAYIQGGAGYSSFFNEVIGDHVQVTAQSSAGGQDRAYFYAHDAYTDVDAPAVTATDAFTSGPGYSMLAATASVFGYVPSRSAFGFASTIVSGISGKTTATLYGGTGTNDLYAAGSRLELDRSTGGNLVITDIVSANAYSFNGAINRQHVAAHDYALSLLGSWS